MKTNFFKRKDHLTTQDWKEDIRVETVHGKGERVHDLIRKTIIHYEMQLNVLEHNIGLMAKEGNDESVDRLKVFRTPE